MKLLDANILLYALIEDYPQHARCREWLSSCLAARQPLAVPWATILAFLRISTHARIMRNPLGIAAAWKIVDVLLDQPGVWVPLPGAGYRQTLAQLIGNHPVQADRIMDLSIAALAIEHGLAVVSADSDFARFPQVSWLNPLTA